MPQPQPVVLALSVSECPVTEISTYFANPPILSGLWSLCHIDLLNLLELINARNILYTNDLLDLL